MRRDKALSGGCRERGITLIELMIVCIILGIMAAIAVPAYNNYVREARRSEARSALNQITAQQAEYILNHGAYADDPALLGIGVTDGDGNTSTESGYYLLEIDPQEDPPPFYEAIATAQNEQAKDTRCQEFKITDTGTKTATSDDCW